MELKDATVLVVDDDLMLLDIFSEWLQEENCRVMTAGNGAAALHILRQHCVDVLVSDVRMPVLDGILLLKNLAALSAKPQNSCQPKMIFISGFTDLEPREAYNLGVEAMLSKPIKRRLFVDAVRRTLRTREERWSQLPTEGGFPLHLALPCVSAAIEQGRIAFGRGGFCLRCSSPISEGPVRFDLEFEGEKVSFAGHGLVRWADRDERLVGVEISYLDEHSRRWALDTIVVYAGSSYIPRAPMGAAPESTAVK